jgi:hypothetical protein
LLGARIIFDFRFSRAREVPRSLARAIFVAATKGDSPIFAAERKDDWANRPIGRKDWDSPLPTVTPLRRDRDEKLDAPVVLVKWYDWTKWLLERVESFPKNQRFVFGQRLADRAIRVLEILVDAAYRPRKAELLAEANRNIEVLRWLVRLAKDRQLLTVRQYGFACKGLTECGRMVGGWLKQAAAKEGEAAPNAS